MTTIASDGKSMTADGRMMSNDRILTDDFVKIGVCDQFVVGVSDCTSYQQPLMDWIAAGADPKHYPAPTSGDGTASILALAKDGSLYWYAVGIPYPIKVPAPFAIGSGGEYAETAMRCGKTPRQAVQISIEMSAHSGGTIRELFLSDIPALKPHLQAAE